MSYLACDGCGRALDPADNAKEARSVAANLGWSRSDGKDYCPDCD